MKLIVVGSALVILMSVLMVSSYNEQSEYFPEEYETVAVAPRGRQKRSATLAFLVGVGAGGILGPILYNKLYGWGSSGRGFGGPKITFYTGWRPASSGWKPSFSGWVPPSTASSSFSSGASGGGWQSGDSSNSGGSGGGWQGGDSSNSGGPWTQETTGHETSQD